MTTRDRPVQLFLSYTRQDEAAVAQLYERLAAVGLKPWMDQEDILPGEMWQESILHAIRDSQFFLACISPNSVDKRGAFQRELREALNAWQEKLPGDIYLIPIRLEDCTVPEQLSQFQWLDLFHDRGWARLLRAIQRGSERLGLQTPDGVPAALAGASTASKTQAPAPQATSTSAATESAQTRPASLPTPPQPAQPASPDLLTITYPVYMEFVCVPAGPFLMGEDKHRVELHEFYIGKYPVTNQQYAAFVQATRGRVPYHWMEGNIPTGKMNHPIVSVTPNEAAAFCRWLSQESRRSVVLPSQAEWEKAACGVDGRTYPWGNEPPNSGLCNFIDSGIGGTTPVDLYPRGASPYGVMDMAGNVWEWTVDRDQDVWTWLKGGSWASSAESMRTVASDRLAPWSRGNSVFGFRVQLVPVGNLRYVLNSES